MNLIQQPDRWSCNGCAWAMAMGISFEELKEAVGHDGSMIYRPKAVDEVHRRLGFLDEQLIYVGLRRGFVAVPVYASLMATHAKEIPGYYFTEEEFKQWIHGKTGVLEVKSWTRDDILHAVAWDGEQVFDPLFGIRQLYEYELKMFVWIFPVVAV